MVALLSMVAMAFAEANPQVAAAGLERLLRRGPGRRFGYRYCRPGNRYRSRSGIEERCGRGGTEPGGLREDHGDHDYRFGHDRVPLYLRPGRFFDPFVCLSYGDADCQDDRLTFVIH